MKPGPQTFTTGGLPGFSIKGDIVFSGEQSGRLAAAVCVAVAVGIGVQCPQATAERPGPTASDRPANPDTGSSANTGDKKTPTSPRKIRSPGADTSTPTALDGEQGQGDGDVAPTNPAETNDPAEPPGRTNLLDNDDSPPSTPESIKTPAASQTDARPGTRKTTPSLKRIHVPAAASDIADESVVIQPAAQAEHTLPNEADVLPTSPDVPPAAPTTDSGPVAPRTATEPMVVQAVSAAVDPSLDPLASGNNPGTPIAAPALWTLLASARRDFEQAFTPAATEGRPVTTIAVGGSTEGDRPNVTALHAQPQLTANTALSAADQSLYTGTPSLGARVVEFALRIVDFVLKPFGGLLAFTSLKIPIFTDGVPPFLVTGGLDVEKTEFDGMAVWTLQPRQPTGQYVVALHGGAYSAQASLFHWSTYADLARDTGATVIVPLYPLISEGGTAGVVVPRTADFIAQTIAAHGAENVSVLGDSAGGGLAVAAIQNLVSRGTTVPARLVLLAPWLDVAISDPRSAALDDNDPLLNVRSLQRDGRNWAGDLGPNDPLASPIYGSFAGMPPTAVFSGSLDLLTPDSLRLRELAISQGLTNFSFSFRNGQIHDWPIFGFIPEAISTRPAIYEALLGTPNAPDNKATSSIGTSGSTRC